MISQWWLWRFSMNNFVWPKNAKRWKYKILKMSSMKTWLRPNRHNHHQTQQCKYSQVQSAEWLAVAARIYCEEQEVEVELGILGNPKYFTVLYQMQLLNWKWKWICCQKASIRLSLFLSIADSKICKHTLGQVHSNLWDVFSCHLTAQ